MNNINYHHDSTQILEQQVNLSNNSKVMEIIPESSNSMEVSIQNHSDHLKLGNDHGSDGEVGLRQSNHSYQLAASISDNNHGASSAYSHVDLSNDIPNSISNGYDLSAGAAPTGYSMSSALSNQSNFMDSQGSASNNPNNGATYNQSGVFNNSNASMIPSSLTNPPPPGSTVHTSGGTADSAKQIISSTDSFSVPQHNGVISHSIPSVTAATTLIPQTVSLSTYMAGSQALPQQALSPPILSQQGSMLVPPDAVSISSSNQMQVSVSQPWIRQPNGMLSSSASASLPTQQLPSMQPQMPQSSYVIPPSGSHSNMPLPPSQHTSSTSFAGAKFSVKAWHGPEHNPLRNNMVDNIIALLKTRRPNATEDWHEKLPHMAKRLEDALYHEAPTFEDYSDRESLKNRLQQLAVSMGGNKIPHASIKQSLPADRQQHVNNQMRQQQQMNLQQQKQYQQHMHQQQYSQQPYAVPRGAAVPQTALVANSQYGGQLPNGSTSTTNYGGSMDYPSHSGMNYHANGGSQELSQQRHYLSQQQHGMIPHQSSSQTAGGYVASSQSDGQNYRGNGQSTSLVPMQQEGNQMVSANTSGHTEEHRKQVLKQQQQRLLLLRHASKCPHENGSCPVTPHCWNMKGLWKHIMSCKDQECKMAHCVSSRYVLSHYSKCKEPTCPVCGPVREAIKRNYERSRESVKVRGGGGHSMNHHLYSTHALPPMHQPSLLHAAPREEPPAKRQKKEKASSTGREKKELERQPMTMMGDDRQSTVLVIPRPKPVVPRSIYPLDPISCAIYSFSAENIQAHLKTVHEGMKLTVSKIKEMCKPVLEDLFKVPHAYSVFGAPVDPMHLGLPDYFDVVRMPMDLGTVMKRLEAGSYRDLHNFVTDVHLTFDNAMVYNPKNSDVYMMAKSLKREFDNKYRQKVNEFERTLSLMRENPDSCLICGEPALKFEPPVYYCNGTCAQRIRRNAVYYSNFANSYHWCGPCFGAMKETDVSRQPDCVITKAELMKNKKKHTDESDEGWVMCECCQRWTHQVCALFNMRRNTGDDVSYVCPLCLQDKRRRNPELTIVAPTIKKMRADDLPVTILSQFLEKRIQKRLSIAYRENAAKLGVSEHDVEKCPQLTLRQVSCQDKLHTVREGVSSRYKEKGYPSDFPCRSKCLVLFQNIDGQDVILFGMYVYEYGHQCPQPNQRRVYISYLDSVHYLRPKQYRTLVYHEILISYLDYVKARGFHTAHIWACPPQKGDDYIFYVHPVDQKTPKPQILRVWYDEMLKKCVERGIVCEVTDIHSEYLLDPSNDATVLPYFEGDYWVNEAEVIIKNLKGQDSKGAGAAEEEDFDYAVGKKSKRKSKTKRLSRSICKPLIVGKSERDPVMSKLASIIEPMKDTFFVARLHPREYAQKFADKLKDEMSAEKGGDSSLKDQKDRLQEEALSGKHVEMPVVASVLSAKASQLMRDASQTAQSEMGVDADDDDAAVDNVSEQDEQYDDDFGKAAFAVSMNDSTADDGMVDVAGKMRASTDFAMAASSSHMGDGEESYPDPPLNPFEGPDAAPQSEMVMPTTAIDIPREVSTVSATPVGRSVRSTRQKPMGKSTIQSDPEVRLKAEDPATDVSMDSVKGASSAIVIKTEQGFSDAAVVVNVKVEEEASNGEDSINQMSMSGARVMMSKGASQMSDSSAALSSAAAAIAVGRADSSVIKEDPVAVEADTVDRQPVSLQPLLPTELIMCGEDLPDLTDDTEDVDDTQESEHFETRQSFLNLCQGNHYQFDQLRRAKHTSMMVLYHLHNPDAPKFVPTCQQCHVDILIGIRHHCDDCEIDYCQNCCVAANYKMIHIHPLRPIAVANSTPQLITEEQRRSRQHSVRLHMELLFHAAHCARCDSKNCHRMKEFLRHEGECVIKTAGGCRLCARISNLLKIHSTNCRIEDCTVPHCLDLREQMRKLSLRQQQMDDRRRKNMNNEYSRGGTSQQQVSDD